MQKSLENESIAKPPTIPNLLKFALPTIITMIIMGTMGIVDGVFVSRIIAPYAMAATGVVWPFVGFVMAIGLMLGVGGNALLAKKIGEDKAPEARQIFSLITIVAIISSVAITAVGLIFPDFILDILGTDPEMYDLALAYMTPLLFFAPATVMGIMLQQFLITVGKAHYGMYLSLVSGIVSAGLNYVFLAVMDMGISGTALASGIGFSIPTVAGVIYFAVARKGLLYYVMPRLDLRALGRTCINGASEMVAMLAGSFTAVIMNNILRDLGGYTAHAAASVAFAGVGIFSALFVGYGSGIMPIISYNYGKNDIPALRRAFRNSMLLMIVFSVAAVALALTTVDALIWIYELPPRGIPITDMFIDAYRFMIAGFLLMGINMFGSMFFTALNNGIVSSILAFFRTLVFVVVAFAVLPNIFGLYGAWAAMPAAEIPAIFMTIIALIWMRKRYQYA
jgi:Na+-driven multidrug efflux pump